MIKKGALPLGTVLPLLVIAVAGLGVGYGLWNEFLPIAGTVETGEVDADFVLGTITEEDHGKEVGECAVMPSDGDGDGDDDHLQVTITNGYPSYECWVAFQVRNNGSVPIHIYQPDFTDLPPDTEVTVDLSACYDDDLQVHADELSLECVLHVHVEQGAGENASYTFAAEVEARQFNEPRVTEAEFLRGEWVFTANGLDSDPVDLTLFINDLEQHPDYPPGEVVLGVGCMQTEESMPLSLQATQVSPGVYDVIIASTVVPSSDPSFVIQFDGQMQENGDGVGDDTSAGDWTTEFGTGAWTGVHLSATQTTCPSVGGDSYFWSDVWADRVYQGTTIEESFTSLEGKTNIVSSAMQVDLPDGSQVIVEPYTDLFTPYVDFVSEFRYQTALSGGPASGQPYTFTLLDVLDNPIPGTTRTDVFTDCLAGPPTGVTPVVLAGNDVDLSWDPVPDVPGAFEPASDIGYYQIIIHGYDWESSTEYGAMMASPQHLIPWAGFGGEAPGSPDGSDFGESLEELENGAYAIYVEMFTEPLDPSLPAVGHECHSWDENEVQHFAKTDTGVTFGPP
jgi:hypothetical protein